MNICVFCSCSPVDESYVNAVREMGQKLGNAGHTLVFGAFSNGLMGAVADGFREASAPIIGVAPRFLEEAGRPVHEGCTTLIETDSLAERKNEMIALADAVVVAPGGIGTLDEAFSVMAMTISGERKVPVAFLNFEGFYDRLIDELHRMKEAGFIRLPIDSIFKVAETPADLIAALISD